MENVVFWLWIVEVMVRFLCEFLLDHHAERTNGLT